MNKGDRLVYVTLVAALFATSFAHSQTAPSPDALFKTIQSLDTQLFDAYNRCDLDKFGSLDRRRYRVLSRQDRPEPSDVRALVEGIKNNICGKVTRELVPGTLEVYPIANYGAVEIGIHRFHHPGHEEPGFCRRGQIHSLSGKTRTECGKSPASSASTTSL